LCVTKSSQPPDQIYEYIEYNEAILISAEDDFYQSDVSLRCVKFPVNPDYKPISLETLWTTSTISPLSISKKIILRRSYGEYMVNLWTVYGNLWSAYSKTMVLLE